MSEKKYRPEEDGITHINVYSKAITGLGRALSNFADIPFTHPVDGKCASVEGYWYYLRTGRLYPHLKSLHGYQAKLEGKKYERVEIVDFQDLIKQAITCKIEQNEKLKSAFILSDLPLAHYYFYASPGDLANAKVIYLDEHNWMVEHLEELRKRLQEEFAASCLKQ